MAVTNVSIPLTSAQWESMSKSQQQQYLQQGGFFDQASAASQRGDTVNWTLADSKQSNSGAQAPKAPSGVGKLGAVAGGAGALYAGNAAKDAIFGTAATTGAETGAALLPGGSSTIFNASMPVATDAATGGTVLADGSVVGGESLLGAAAPWLGVGAAGLGALSLAKNFGKGDTKGGALAGLGMGGGLAAAAPLVGLGPVGWGGLALAAGAGALGGGLIGSIKTGKSKAQTGRDQWRTGMKNIGVADDNYDITLADGTKYNIGRDGGYRDADGRRSFELSLTPDELQHQSVGWSGPLAALMTGRSDDATDQLSGQLAKAAMSNAGGKLETSRANLLGILNKMGITQEQAGQMFDKMAADKVIDANKAAAYKAAIGGLTSGKYFTNELERFKASQAGQALPAGVDSLTGRPVASSATKATVAAPSASPTTAAPATSNPNSILGMIGMKQPATSGPMQGPGKWYDSKGNLIDVGLGKGQNPDPGFTLGNRFVPDPVSSPSPTPAAAPTRSVGFDDQGRRINYTDEQRRKAQNRALMAA